MPLSSIVDCHLTGEECRCCFWMVLFVVVLLFVGVMRRCFCWLLSGACCCLLLCVVVQSRVLCDVLDDACVLFG